MADVSYRKSCPISDKGGTKAFLSTCPSIFSHVLCKTKQPSGNEFDPQEAQPVSLFHPMKGWLWNKVKQQSYCTSSVFFAESGEKGTLAEVTRWLMILSWGLKTCFFHAHGTPKNWRQLRFQLDCLEWHDVEIIPYEMWSQFPMCCW